MAEMIMREAIAYALREALDSNENAFMMGEDIGAYGGAYAVTRGFLEDYGPERIRDTPISESVVVGAATGAAMIGLKPIVELMTINFSLLAMDQIVNHATKIHYMSNGQFKVPMILRTVTGGGGRLAATHSQSLEGWYATLPGIKVVAPSTPYDAIGLFRTAMKDDNPILYAEHALLYGTRGAVPDDYFEVPFGEAAIRRPGEDVTIISYSGMMNVALKAAAMLADKGRSAEVIDLRTLRPLDMDTILESVRKTSRAIVVEETWYTGGFGAHIVGEIQQAAFDDLDGPVARVASEDVPAPYAANLEAAALPSAEKVVRAIERSFGI